MPGSVIRSQPSARGGRWVLTGLLAVAVTGLLGAAPLTAQTGAITGTITNARSGAPLSAARVSVEGTGLGALTQPNGKFLILKVPAGTYTVNAVLIGYANMSMKVTVTDGGSAVADMKMVPEAVSLSEIVVTGVASPTQRAKLPFDVSQLRTADMPVPQLTVATALAGKVAGVAVVAGSSRPGQAPDILLRGPTSIDANGRSEQPLYIVDGVILGSSLVNLDALDIKSIEIVKGAAGASLYGSRGAAGVIQIMTKRGTSMANGVVHYTLRSELGQNHLGPTPSAYLAKYQPYAVDSNGLFIDSQGNHCVYLLCQNALAYANNAAWVGSDTTASGAYVNGAQWGTVQDIPWPGRTYDQVQRFFSPALYMQNYAAAEGRLGATNFHVSMSNLRDGAVMPGDIPFNRTNLRVNVDHVVSEKVQVQASGFYSRSTQPTSTGDLHALTRVPAGTNLLAPDPNDSTQMVLQVDPNNTETVNPIYENEAQTNTLDRGRFLGSVNVRYSPTTWMDIDANGSYDRLDQNNLDLYPKGYRTVTPSSTLNNGSITKYSQLTEASNASLTATIRHTFLSSVHSTTTVRYLYEDDEEHDSNASGYDFVVSGVPTLANVDQTTVSASSTQQSMKADGYFLDEALDINSRYEIDALVRNDGISVFDSAKRRQWYYRGAVAWRLTQEPWFHINGLNELKLHYALGTAGNRPWLDAQYETSGASGGRVTPITMGNTDLKPEFSTEQEAGIDAAVWNNRVTLGLTYAHNNTADQLLQVPLPASTGFVNQWRNAGTLTSDSYEGTLNVELIQTDNLDWSVKALFSKNTATITALNVAPFTFGIPSQGVGTVFYARPGEKYGTIYGEKAARKCSDLPTGVQDKCDEFVVNDDGFLVWVGQGGNLSDDKWGTNSDVQIRGSSVKWGTVFPGECTDRSTGERTLFCPVGNSTPAYDLNFETTLRYKGINLYALVTHSSGFSIYNQSLQLAVFAGTAGIFDQEGIPAARQKPVQYFSAEYGNLGGLQPSDVFVEDGTFTKLKEVSVSYRFNAKQLAGIPFLEHFNGMGLALDGENLLKWTNYRGFDPEVGGNAAGTDSAALVRVEGNELPPLRTLSATVELIF